MSGTAWYKGISFKSATLSDHGADAYTGMIREHLGAFYILVLTADILGNGEVVKKDTTTGGNITVIPCAAVTDRALGVYQGPALSTTGWFIWVLMRGRGYASPDGTWADGDMIGPSATPGASAKVAADAIGSVYGIAIRDSSGALTSNTVLFDFGFGWSSDSTP